MLGKLLVIGSIAAILPRIITLVISLGLHKTLYDHSPGQCRLLPGIEYGSEDIQVTSKGIAFITSGLKYKTMISASSPIYQFETAVFVLDLNKPQPLPVELKRVGEPQAESFNPHGLSIWESKTGDVFVYIINHLPEHEAVDKYLYDQKTNSLIFKRRIEGEENFHITNDLVVVGDNDEFYMSNFVYSSNLEIVLRLRWGSIVFFDGKSSRIVADNLLVANGITMSKDGKYIYLAENGDHSLVVYHRNADNSLTFASKTDVYTGLDNLDLDRETGEIWTGCHPVTYKAIQHLEDPSIPAPSQVLKIKVNGEKVESVQEMYVDATGETISGSSVAAKYKNKLLIGTVNHKALICDM